MVSVGTTAATRAGFISEADYSKYRPFKERNGVCVPIESFLTSQHKIESFLTAQQALSASTPSIGCTASKQVPPPITVKQTLDVSSVPLIGYSMSKPALPEPTTQFSPVKPTLQRMSSAPPVPRAATESLRQISPLRSRQISPVRSTLNQIAAAAPESTQQISSLMSRQISPVRSTLNQNASTPHTGYTRSLSAQRNRYARSLSAQHIGYSTPRRASALATQITPVKDRAPLSQLARTCIGTVPALASTKIPLPAPTLAPVPVSTFYEVAPPAPSFVPAPASTTIPLPAPTLAPTPASTFYEVAPPAPSFVPAPASTTLAPPALTLAPAPASVSFAQPAPTPLPVMPILDLPSPTPLPLMPVASDPLFEVVQTYMDKGESVPYGEPIWIPDPVPVRNPSSISSTASREKLSPTKTRKGVKEVEVVKRDNCFRC